MTTPTREQVVQWAEKSGVVIYSQVEVQTIGILTDFATLARADLQHECSAKDQTILSLEATIAEKDAEIERLQTVVLSAEKNALLNSQKVVAQQAHIEQLRGYLNTIQMLAIETAFSVFNVAEIQNTVTKALSTSSSADALREYGAKLLERIAEEAPINGNHMAQMRILFAAERIRKGEF